MRLYYFLLIILLQSQVFGQMIGPEAVLSAGGIQVTGNVMISWSLGETMIITVSNGNNYVTQ
ncbi:MAG: hypothetical protein KDD99_30760, partial [Bacteroidetes bacterium]|nr:hypothetical protein [Bacteroidota bacterium]